MSTVPSTHRALPPSEIDHVVVLHGVPWTQYEALLATRGESSVPRMTYRRGDLELVGTSRHHERIKKTLARLLEAWADAKDVDLEGFGSWTLKSAALEQGLEPDECYVVGGRETDAPDVAIEVVWTHGPAYKLHVYAALGVREVWVWEEDVLRVHALRDGAYEVVDRSEVLPDVDLALLGSLATKPQRDAVKALREALAGE